MSDLVLPPWDLCGFDRDFDPYSCPSPMLGFAFSEMISFRPGPLLVDGAVVPGAFEVLEWGVEPARDPNGADGRWRELAFMPHVADSVPNGVERVEVGKRIAFRAKWVEVPAYLTVREALVHERYARDARWQQPSVG